MENEDAMMVSVAYQHLLVDLYSHELRFQSRPFGVALLVAGIDELGPQL